MQGVVSFSRRLGVAFTLLLDIFYASVRRHLTCLYTRNIFQKKVRTALLICFYYILRNHYCIWCFSLNKPSLLSSFVLRSCFREDPRPHSLRFNWYLKHTHSIVSSTQLTFSLQGKFLEILQFYTDTKVWISGGQSKASDVRIPRRGDGGGLDQREGVNLNVVWGSSRILWLLWSVLRSSQTKVVAQRVFALVTVP